MCVYLYRFHIVQSEEIHFSLNTLPQCENKESYSENINLVSALENIVSEFRHIGMGLPHTFKGNMFKIILPKFSGYLKYTFYSTLKSDTQDN